MNLDMSYDFVGLFTSDQGAISKSNGVNPDDVITGSFNILQKGTRWQSHGIEVIVGESQYLIGSNYYLPQKYTDQQGIVTIRGDNAHGLQSVDGDGAGWRYSEYYFKGQTEWKVLEIVTINNEPYYRVSSIDYINFDSTHGAGK